MKNYFITLTVFSGLLMACGNSDTSGKTEAADSAANPPAQPAERAVQQDAKPIIPGKSNWQSYSFDINVLPYEGKGALILTMRYQAFQHQQKYPLAGAEEVLHTISTDLDKNDNPEVYSLVKTSEGLKCWGMSFINKVQPVELTLDKIGILPENSRWLSADESGLLLLNADSTALGSITASQVDGKMNFELK